MTRDAVTSDQLPASGLPFSVAVRGGGLLFLSGQVAQDPATGELVDGATRSCATSRRPWRRSAKTWTT